MCVCVCVYVCVYSNSRYDSVVRNHCRTHPAPCVRPRCSVLHAHAQFCRFDKADATPTFSDTAITDRHSDTTIFQLRAHWVRISWSVGSEKSFGHVPPPPPPLWESNPRLPACKASTLPTRPGSLLPRTRGVIVVVGLSVAYYASRKMTLFLILLRIL